VSGWDPDFAVRSPLFRPFLPWARCLAEGGRWPDTIALNRLAEANEPQPLTLSGLPIRFVTPDASTLPYEIRIAETGEVPTRPRSWHDCFNALAWFAFPRAKARLNALHAAEVSRLGHRERGPVRDALTLLDESGVLVLTAEPELWELLRARRWKALFWERREEPEAGIRFVVFGHALLEKLLAPYPGITGKCVWFPASDLASPSDSLSGLDAAFAQWLEERGRLLTPKSLPPLPVLGIPGATPDNTQPEYYEDRRQFRP
jgi:hypothetical protein